MKLRISKWTFLLNSHGTRSPLTIGLLSSEHFHIMTFPLGLKGADTEAYFFQLLGCNLCKLCQIVAPEPLAAIWCPHWTVRMFIDKLFIFHITDFFPIGVLCRGPGALLSSRHWHYQSRLLLLWRLRCSMRSTEIKPEVLPFRVSKGSSSMRHKNHCLSLVCLWFFNVVRRSCHYL